MVRIALMTPAVDVETFGVTVIETLLPGATVPLFEDNDRKVFAFASPVIAQFKGALPGLDRVNGCCAGFFPWIVLKVSAFVVRTIAGRGEGPTVWVMGGGLAVAVTFKVVTFMVTVSVKGLFVPCWKKLM